MTQAVKSIIIVGGGSAGWLTAGTLAAKHRPLSHDGIKVTLVESPNIKTIGVGEGTWPTMRSTLRAMGISETDFIRNCDVSFKQGTKFVGWRTGTEGDFFYQPFTLPQGYFDCNLTPFWKNHSPHTSYSNSVCHQESLCEQSLAPKQITTPEYQDITNYAYHLNAGKFSEFIREHCVKNLGVTHILDDVVEVKSHPNGDIQSVVTTNHGDLTGQLFIDCTGFASLLLGKHYQVPFISKQDILFIDKALALQLPYQQEDEEIVSATLSTAQEAGWIWDIGLQSRRGIGHVYASDFMSQDEAYARLMNYACNLNVKAKELEPRAIDIRAGHRKIFWKQNCVAVGLSAGFLEPLEASALALVEYSAKLISERLPKITQHIAMEAAHFNRQMAYHWQGIIDFLKLHYVLSEREEGFWRANRSEQSIPDSLREKLALWQYRIPEFNEFEHAEEVFPAAAYQYVLYGMNFKCQLPHYLTDDPDKQAQAASLFQLNRQLTEQTAPALTGNRDLINKILTYGLQKV